jgi:DNA-binding MarR family transcriptional regulator
VDGDGIDPVACEAVDAFFTVLGRMYGYYSGVCASLDLTPHLGSVLRGLAEPSPMRELARELHLDASNLTGLVDRLEQRGLVRRAADPQDRRVRQVALTEAGMRLRHELNVRLMRDPPLLAGLDADERGRLRSLLGRAAAEPADRAGSAQVGRGAGGPAPGSA